MESLIKMLTHGKRMDRPNSCPKEVYNMAMKCWDEKPANRPTFKILHKFFDDRKSCFSYVTSIHINHNSTDTA